MSRKEPMKIKLFVDEDDHRKKISFTHELEDGKKETVTHDLQSIENWADKGATSLAEAQKVNPKATESDLKAFHEAKDAALDAFKSGTINYDTMRSHVYKAKMKLYDRKPVKENSPSAKNIDENWRPQACPKPTRKIEKDDQTKDNDSKPSKSPDARSVSNAHKRSEHGTAAAAPRPSSTTTTKPK